MKDRPDIPLFLFAKAPVPGLVKTRMRPDLDDRLCARLACVMLEQSVEKISGCWPGSLVLTVAPDSAHPVFQNLRRRFHCDLEVQIQGDLGRKMFHVLEKSVMKCGRGVVMGSDVPQFSGEILSGVHARMMRGENIVGPASDGGFYLLGVNETADDMFAHIEWGRGRVLDRVLKNLRRNKMEVGFCERLRDIDDWNDLCWLAGVEARYHPFVS